MEQNDNKSGFTYKYSSDEQSEIKRIRDKYLIEQKTPEESKMDRLRRLDGEVTKKGTIVSLIIGVISTIVMGSGMSLFMTDIGAFLGSDLLSMLIGIVLGFVGITGVALAYPVYNYITKKERERIAPEILKLSEELMK